MSHTINPTIKDYDKVQNGKFNNDPSEPEATTGPLVHGVDELGLAHPISVDVETQDVNTIDEMVLIELKSISSKLNTIAMLLEALAD